MKQKNRSFTRKPKAKPRPALRGWKGLVDGEPVYTPLQERFNDYLAIPEVIDVGSISSFQAAAMNGILTRLVDILNRDNFSIDTLFADNFDGKWSANSRPIFFDGYLRSGISPFGEAYAITSHRWSCPCCGRTKKDFVRPVSGGRFVGDIVKHHDHAEDFSYLPRFSGGIHICSDCNGAEAQAKRLLREEFDCPEWFTFTIDEIREFITVRPNTDHSVDEERAYRLMRLDHRYGRNQAEIAVNCEVLPTSARSLLSEGYDKLYKQLEKIDGGVSWSALPLRVLRAFWRKRSIWPDKSRPT